MRFAMKLSIGLLLMIGLMGLSEQLSLAQKGGGTTGGAVGTGATGTGTTGTGAAGTGAVGTGAAGTGAVGQTPGTAGPGVTGQAPGGIPTGTPPALPNTSNFQPGVSQLPSTGGVPLPRAGFNPQPLLMNPQIGQNLGLNSQQLNQLNTNQTQLLNTFNTQLQQLQQQGNLTPAQRNAQLQALTNQFNTQFGTAANSVLTPTQQQRLQQLQLQQAGVSAFFQPSVQAQLKLTPGQIGQLQQHQADFNRQMQLIQRTQDPARRQQLFQQLQEAQNLGIRGVLNQSQLQTFEQLTGQPFSFTSEMMSPISATGETGTGGRPRE